MDNMIEKIQALEPGKIYLLSVNFTSCDIESLISLLDDAKEKQNISFMCIDKNSTEVIPAPEGLKVMMSKTKGLQRIRIFNKHSKNEVGTSDYMTHWLLEDKDRCDYFMVLSNHFNTGVGIERYKKTIHRYEEIK